MSCELQWKPLLGLSSSSVSNLMVWPLMPSTSPPRSPCRWTGGGAWVLTAVTRLALVKKHGPRREDDGIGQENDGLPGLKCHGLSFARCFAQNVRWVSLKSLCNNVPPTSFRTGSFPNLLARSFNSFSIGTWRFRCVTHRVLECSHIVQPSPECFARTHQSGFNSVHRHRCKYCIRLQKIQDCFHVLWIYHTRQEKHFSSRVFSLVRACLRSVLDPLSLHSCLGLTMCNLTCDIRGVILSCDCVCVFPHSPPTVMHRILSQCFFDN